jgi:polyphosphate:AMP phosphotransferase
MFGAVELGQTVPKQEFKSRALGLRQQLLETQIALSRSRNFGVMIDFAGVDGAGKGSTVNLLHAWMDTRLITTNAYGELSEAERMHPRFWRFWRDLPSAGRIAMNLSGRYSQPILDHVFGRISDAEFDAQLRRIQAFERTLADEGMLILKFWMHLSRDAQKARLDALEADPEKAWRVTQKDWEHWELYEEFIGSAEKAIAETNTDFAPWHLIEGFDSNHRILEVAQIVLDAINSRFAASGQLSEGRFLIDSSAMEAQDSIPDAPGGHVTVFDKLDMTKSLGKGVYRKKLAKHQRRIHLLQRDALKQDRSSILVFEGPDAAGKGGTIRRLITTLDARHYEVMQYGAPTKEERAHHYLWRFWRPLERTGRLTIFDRSWYGRVLVERVEGLAQEGEWRRAYAEINEFEDQLIEHGTILVKFWLHISPDAQRARFEDRKRKPYKQWKLTSEDWRNRAKWYDYENAAHDMVKYTSTRVSPWELVPANSKNYARVRVLKTFGDYLESALN